MKSFNLKRIFSHYTTGWAVISIIGVALVVLPIFDVVINLFKAPNENWYHIQEYLLTEYTLNSLTLAVSTAFFTVLIGVFLAWIVTVYDFLGRRFFQWALILPMAIPGYIAAYTYAGMLSYTGVIQTTLRNQFSLTLAPKYFDIMSIEGAIFIFTISLFPYVYIITKAFLQNQSSALIENARLLGHKPTSIFFRVVLPISRVAIIGGMTLVVLEVLSDYGVVKYFGVNTFSTAIFKTWFGMGDIDTAVRLAGVLMIFVIVLMTIDVIAKGRRRYALTTTKVRPIKPVRLRGIKAFIAFVLCFTIFALGFLIPVLQLIQWATLGFANVLNQNFGELLVNTVLVATIATILILFFAVVIANFNRLRRSKISKAFAKIVTIGYSIPGAIIAIAVIVFIVAIDNGLGGLYDSLGMQTTLVLSNSLVMLIFAYFIRYLAVGYNNIDAGFEKQGMRYLEASRMLGFGITKSFFKVDLPLMKGAIVSAAILTFVDIVKELPLTMTLRPFNFDTLATQTFAYANDERFQEAAIPALIIIAVSMTAIIIFHVLGEKRRANNASKS